MTVGELRAILHNLMPNEEIMVVTDVNGPSIWSSGVQSAYRDVGGSKLIVMLSLYGNPDLSRDSRKLLAVPNNG